MKQRTRTIPIDEVIDEAKQPSSAKCCSFRDIATVYTVPSAISLTEDAKQLWFQDEDYKKFKKNNRKIVNYVDKNGRGKNGKRYCTLGLERYMNRDELKGERQLHRKNILRALDGDEDYLLAYESSTSTHSSYSDRSGSSSSHSSISDALDRHFQEMALRDRTRWKQALLQNIRDGIQFSFDA